VGVPLERRSEWTAAPAQGCNRHNQTIPRRKTNSRKPAHVDLADLIYDGLVQPRKSVLAVKVKEIKVREDGWPFIVPVVPVGEWQDPFPIGPEDMEKYKPQVGGYWVIDSEEYWL